MQAFRTSLPVILGFVSYDVADGIEVSQQPGFFAKLTEAVRTVDFRKVLTLASLTTAMVLLFGQGRGRR